MSVELAPLPLAMEESGEGVELVFSDGPTFGVVDLALQFCSGAADEAIAGVTALAFELPEHGTQKRDRAELRQALDAIAARYRADVGKGHVSLRLRVLERHLQPALDLLVEMLLEARDDAHDFARVVQEFDEDTRSLLEAPDGVASLALPQALWPATRWALPSAGSPAARRRLASEMLAKRRAEVLASPVRVGIAASDPTRHRETLCQLVEVLGLRPGAPPHAVPAVAPAPRWGRAMLVAFPRSEQAVVQAVGPAPALQAPEYPAVQLHNMVFAGGFATPLIDRIRSREGLSYSVGAHLSANHARGLVVFSANPQGGQALRTVRMALDCWEDFLESPLTSEALERARLSWLGRRALGLETPGARMEAALHVRLHGMSLDALDERAQKVASLTLRDVTSAGASYGWDKGLVVCAVGDLPNTGTDPLLERLEVNRALPEDLAELVADSG